MRALVATVIVALALPALAEPPEKGARADFLKRYTVIQDKVVSLVEAMSQEQLGWRPAEGVFSWTEALIHVAQTNYKQAKMLGHDVPAAIDLDKLSEVKSKGGLLKTLKGSYDHLNTAIGQLKDSELDDEIMVWGKPGTKRYVIILAMAHSAEHLGQGIAYARIKGVTPPWSKKQ